MLQFILTYVALLSFGVLLVLIVRSWPRVEEQHPGGSGKFSHWLLSEMPMKVDRFLSKWIERIFRRLKVILLRFDNYLTERLRVLSLGTKEKPKIDFKEIENTSELGQSSEGERRP